MKQVVFLIALVLLYTAATYAQPRPADKTDAPTVAKSVAPAPASFPAKYEGGLFGYNEKQKGILKFDDANERLVFLDENQKEMFGIPYKSVLVIQPHSRSVTSTTGNVVRHIPLPGAGLAGLIREKRRYMILQFSDADADVRGTVSFKLEDKELLSSVLRTLGEKAGLQQRGDAYYRPRPAPKPVI